MKKWTLGILGGVLLAALFFGGVYFVGTWLFPSATDGQPASLAASKEKLRASFGPGMYDLIGCEAFVSLNGMRTLILGRDNKATIANDIGTWSFDNMSRRYVVNVGAVSGSFLLLRPEALDVCMLIAGDTVAADLSGSWFAKTEPPPEDYKSRLGGSDK